MAKLRLGHVEDEAPACQQGALPHGRSKVPAALLVLVLLLAAATAIFRLSIEITRLQKNLQTHRAENESGTSESPSGVGPHKNVSVWCQENRKMLPEWELHGESCYLFSRSRLSWDKSRGSCLYSGGDLVKVDSAEEERFLEERVREKMDDAYDKFWIGLTDSQREGVWVWVDGSPLDASLSFWNVGEPDNWTVENREGEDCVRMGAGGLTGWDDRSCDVSHRSICEKPRRTLNTHPRP